MANKTQNKANKLGAGALSMFDAALQDLRAANSLHAQVEDEAAAEVARLQAEAAASQAARLKNERVAAKIELLINGEE